MAIAKITPAVFVFTWYSPGNTRIYVLIREVAALADMDLALNISE
jgi:hypothetical protein